MASSSSTADSRPRSLCHDTSFAATAPVVPVFPTNENHDTSPLNLKTNESPSYVYVCLPQRFRPGKGVETICTVRSGKELGVQCHLFDMDVLSFATWPLSRILFVIYMHLVARCWLCRERIGSNSRCRGLMSTSNDSATGPILCSGLP
jgi:hypothetical protein